MSRSEIRIATSTLSGLSVAEPSLLLLLNDETFQHAWNAREIIKQEGDRCVARIRAQDGTAYLIKSARPAFRKRLLGLLFPPLGKAHRSLATLDQHKIPIARALAFVKWKLPGQPERWCQIQDYLDGALTLEQALTADCRHDHQQQRALITETARQLARLHNLGRYHGDMKLTNIMVRGDRIFLVDIQGHRSLRLRRWRQKDLARFLVGLKEADIPERQLEEVIALYQQHSDNNDPGFMNGVDGFIQKISQRRLRRYGSPMRNN